MKSPASISRKFQLPLSALRAPLATGCLLLASAVALRADADAVAKAIENPPGGSGPTLWFEQSADHNQGSGDPKWEAGSGARMLAQDADAWGNDGAAFGLPPTASRGAGVSGSGQSDLLCTDEGTVVFFLKNPSLSVSQTENILVRGIYDPAATTFLLQVAEGNKLRLYTGLPNEPHKSWVIDMVPPDQWNFIALSWKKNGETFDANAAIGEMIQGAALNFYTGTIPNTGNRDLALHLAGTEAEAVETVFTEARFNNFAIYDRALTEEALQAIHQAALKGLR